MIAIVTALRLACAFGGAECLEQGVTPKDSQSILRRARSAQEKFERTRRSHLPWIDPGWTDQCDERRNFSCFTYGDPEEAWKPPKEAEQVTTARDSLLALLARSARDIPGDRWVTGQRVRYLVEAGKVIEARVAAYDCASIEAWWCSALAGYAAHAAEDYQAAEAAYDKALAIMDAAQSCLWRDISLLLPESPSHVYRRLGCETRDPLERRFWWIADPVYLVPGNERRSEHFSRFVYLEFEGHAPAVKPSRAWLEDSEGWVIRYGRPAGWERERSRSLTLDPDPSIVTHFPGPSQVFEPSWKALEAVESVTPDALPLRREGAQTGYVPTYAERFDTLRYQVATFRRGNRVSVVGAYDLSSDSLPPSSPALAGLFLAPNDHEPAAATRAQQSVSGVLTLQAPPRPGLVSLETIATDGKRAGRVRYWLPIRSLEPGVLSVSDILLLSRSDLLPRSLEAAIPLARAGTSLPFGETAGLYWEVYGLGPGTVPVSMSLTLVKESTSWLHRTARSLKLAGKDRPAVSLSWVAGSHPDGEPMTEALALDLTKNDPGRYTLQIEVSSQGRGTTTTQREIVIAR